MATAKSAGIGELEFTSALSTAGCSCLLSPTHEAMIPLVIQDEFIIKGVLRCPLSLLPNSHTIGRSRYSLPAWIGTFSGMLWKAFYPNRIRVTPGAMAAPTAACFPSPPRPKNAKPN